MGVIVIGGGLGGLSAAHTIMEHGIKVVVIDKSSFFGGNSTKATSGINGALTKSQRKLNIQDSPEIFEGDCMRGGASRPHLGLTFGGPFNAANASWQGKVPWDDHYIWAH